MLFKVMLAQIKMLLTRSRPELSAFQAITGIPKYPASCKKYCADAVSLPYAS